MLEALFITAIIMASVGGTAGFVWIAHYLVKKAFKRS